MKPLNKYAFKNLPATMSFWSQSTVNKTKKYPMRNKKSDHIHQILVIMERKIVFCKKVIKMIMKIDVPKTGIRTKKAHYEIWDTLIKTCQVHTRLSITAMVSKCPVLLGSFF